MKRILRTSKIILAGLLLLTAMQGKAQLKAAFTGDVTSGCSPLLVNFTNQSTGTDANTTYYWDLGNGGNAREKNPSALFLNSGSGSVTYTVKLVIRSVGSSDSIVKKSYITVYASPKVSFTSDVNSGCPPLNVKFTDGTKPGSGTIKTWLWDFGEGQLSSSQNPSTTYHYSSTYNVSLTVVNSYGCKQVSDGSNIIHVLDTVGASFDYHFADVCQSPSPVNFNNTSVSASGITSYSWDFGDGQTDNTQSPSHTYPDKGTYTVKLTAVNSAGCKDTTVQKVVIGKAGADFNYTNACVNSGMRFTDASSETPLSSSWTFGDGGTSKETSPTHVYAATGLYKVTLVASFGSCTSTIYKTVSVVNRPTASFTASASNVCAVPYPVTFTGTSQGATSYEWKFGDGKVSYEQSPVHTYTTANFYDVRLIAFAGSGCADTSIQQSVVKLGPPQIDSIKGLPVRGCVPQAITPEAAVKVAEPIATYIWTFGDGATSNEEKPQHTYTQTGSYAVSLIVITASGCSDTLTMKNAVKVGIAPDAAFNATPLNTCARVSVAFTDSSQGTITNWLWKFGDGSEGSTKNPTHHYMDTGWFTVTLIASNADCKDTAVREKYVYIKSPVANYQSGYDCAKPYDRIFTDKSIAAKTWAWDFGDGNTDTARNPGHTFAKTGTYIVKLKVTNDECYDSLQVKMQVVDEHPDFTFDYIDKAACRNTAVTFTATNINAANINAYKWMYGDTTTASFAANAAVPTHAYTVTGTYTPQLITRDILGCMDTVISKTPITIYGPTARFANDTGICINSIVSFRDSTKTDGIHDIQKWNWTYEPGVVQTYTSAASFTHPYTKEGYYDVVLAVQDSYGCTDSVKRVKALQVTNPIAAFSVSDSLKCAKNKISFTNGSTGEKLSYSWNFGDNSTSKDTAHTIAHSYTSEGVYTVSLSVSDKFSCKSDTTIVNAVTVSNPKAVMVINGPTSTTCPPLLVKPLSASLNTTSLSWNFGDGSLSRIDTPSHNYVMGGSYDLMLIAKGYGECSDTAHQMIKLKGPSGKMTYDPLLHCNPSSVSFSCETKDAVKVTWDFNDGIVEPDNSTHSTMHIYKNNGKYLPKLLMTDKDGCFVGIENLDTIYVSGAKADFLATSQAACDSSVAAFVQTSTPYYDTIQSYQWNFGDGYTSTKQNPEHFYTKTGSYDAKLSVTTKGGCKDSVQYPVSITVHITPKVTLVASDSACIQSSVSMYGTDNLNENGSIWNWSYGDNTSDSGNSRTNHTYTSGGQHRITAIITTPYGCADTTSRLLTIVDLPNVSAGPDSFVCIGSTMMLQATGAATYRWQNSNTLSCTSCATPIAAPETNASYVVTGANAFGCVATDSLALEVIKPQTLHVKNDTLCMGENATLEAEGTDLYSWTPALFLDNSTSATPQFHAAKDTLMTYTVSGMDRKKCFTDNRKVTVKVYPIPHVEIAERDINLNVGFTTKLGMKSSADVTQWRWEPQQYLDDARLENPTASPKHTITYNCVASNNGSCFARDQVTIHVMCNDANMFIPNTFSPNKDGVNDKFFPRGTGVFNIKSLQVFNRWGEMVYEKVNFLPNSESDGWDGTYKGQPVASDVYVYMLNIICENNTVIPFKGNVTLVR